MRRPFDWLAAAHLLLQSVSAAQWFDSLSVTRVYLERACKNRNATKEIGAKVKCDRGHAPSMPPATQGLGAWGEARRGPPLTARRRAVV